jgi:hypothetical protein
MRGSRHESRRAPQSRGNDVLGLRLRKLHAGRVIHWQHVQPEPIVVDLPKRRARVFRLGRRLLEHADQEFVDHTRSQLVQGQFAERGDDVGGE